MRQLRTIVWKEWRETRIFLAIAWMLFIGLPIIGGLEQQGTHSNYFEFESAPWVTIGGFALAVILGVAGTCRDLQPKLEDFWQSRPIGTLRLFLIKFGMGLVILLLSCDVPLLIQQWSRPSGKLQIETVWISIQVVTLFAIAFAAGCILRRPANAAAVAVVTALVLYCLPIVLPPLQRFNVGNFLDVPVGELWKHEHITDWPLANSVLAMTTVSGTMLLLGLIAARQRWRIDATRPLLYGAVATALVVLLGSASYQVGTTLPVLDSIEIKPAMEIEHLQVDQACVTAWASRWQAFENDTLEKSRDRCLSIEVQNGHLKILSKRSLPYSGDYRFLNGFWATNPRDPSIVYRMQYPTPSRGEYQRVELSVSRTVGDESSDIYTIPLWDSSAMGEFAGYLYIDNDRLYVEGSRSIVFDISDAFRIRKLTDVPALSQVSVWQAARPYSDNFPPVPSLAARPYIVNLPPAPGLSAEKRLDFAMRITGAAFDGSTCCLAWNDGHPGNFSVLRLASIDNEKAHFNFVAQYEPTLIDSMFFGPAYQDVKISNHFLYIFAWRSVSVFDLSKPGPLRVVAHFAGPSFISAIQPLADGRLIVASSKIYLLGAPRR